MKAVGNNPLERYVGPGDGRRHRPQRRVTPPTKISSTGTTGEPIHPAQDHLRTGLDFDLIGWSEGAGHLDLRSDGAGDPPPGGPEARLLVRALGPGVVRVDVQPHVLEPG